MPRLAVMGPSVPRPTIPTVIPRHPKLSPETAAVVRASLREIMATLNEARPAHSRP
jgi:hypothetical protein